MDAVIKALNDPTRREIMEILKNGDVSAGDIAERFKMAKSSISHHLEILRKGGVVESEKRGQHIIYSIKSRAIEELIQWLTPFKEESLGQKPRIRLHISH